ncbi:MAG: discoidin domain-containing protein, partial [Ignavibacteriaceae bacterium]
MKNKSIILIFFSLSFINLNYSQSKLVDDFENIGNWNKVVSDGVTMELSLVDGFKGKCLRIDYEFKGSGYCGIQKDFVLHLPNDYKFSYYIKANSPKNNLELKLIDSTGDNVWWLNQPGFEFPNQWQKMVVKKRDINFAWGPKGGGDLKKVFNLQIIIAAAQGGKGTVYIDELRFDEIFPPKNPNAMPIVSASSTEKGSAENLLLKEKNAGWKSSLNREQFILIDFQFVKEYGGLIIDWGTSNFAKKFDVFVSNDKTNWDKVYSDENCNGNFSFIFLKNGESRYVKIAMHKSNKSEGYAINKIEVKDFEFSKNYNNFFKDVAAKYSKGFFPKYFYDVQSYWNIIGVSEDYKEGLINEEGAIEVDKGSFRIEPFLYSDNKLITWTGEDIHQNLEENYLPIPSVIWNKNDLQLEIKTFGEGEAGKSSIFARYRVTNNSSLKKEGSLYLAIRPFQVNPPWQFLNIVGGISKIESINFTNGIVTVNNDKKIIPLNSPNSFGASKFSSGEIITYLQNDSLPSLQNIEDDFGFASAALKFDFKIDPNSFKDFVLIIPFYSNSNYLNIKNNSEEAENLFETKLKNVKNFWKEKLNSVKFNLPESAGKYINTLRSNLAYILINKDGPAIQPGSRSYERAWIRDGSLTSSALLRLGIKKEVKDYLDWYAKFQYPNGKIPCVV